MRAIIIDEERGFSDLFSDALAIIDIESTQIWDASEAVEFFRTDGDDLPEDTLFFIAVGLDCGEDTETFSRKKTTDFILTGLILVEKLVSDELITPKQLRKVSLYTSHYMATNWNKIDDFCEKHNLHRFKKSPLMKVDDIHEKVMEVSKRK